MLPKVKEELERMVQLNNISPVKEATEWCAKMVVVHKSNDKVRICVDLSRFNGSLCQDKHIMQTVEEILGQVGRAKHFSN